MLHSTRSNVQTDHISLCSLPLGVQIDGGSDWICLNRQFAQYVVHSTDPLVSGLKKVFKHTLLPAESFFHTVLRNSEHCHTYIDNNLHLTNWKRKQGCKCQYKAIVDWCGCSPNDFLPEDWAKLEGTRPKQLFFARKFEPIVHQGVLNSVQEWTTNSTMQDQTKLSYWQNAFHAADSKHRHRQQCRFLEAGVFIPLTQHIDIILMAGSSYDLANLHILLEREVERVSEISSHKLKFRSVETLTSYSHSDAYEGSLVLCNIENLDTGDQISVEFKIKYRPKSELGPRPGRVQAAAVGAEFDPKE